jgi:hypothetical protein
VAKDLFAEKYRNLGCVAVIIAVFFFFFLAAAGVLRQTHDKHPKWIDNAQIMIELRAKKMARHLSDFIEAGDLGNAGALMQQALDNNGWLYVELNLRPSSMPALSVRPSVAGKSNASEISKTGVPDNGSTTTAPAPEKSRTSDDLPFITALFYGNASTIPPTIEERKEAWNAIIRHPSFRKSRDIDRRKILTVVVLVRKIKRRGPRLHGFLLIRGEFGKIR